MSIRWKRLAYVTVNGRNVFDEWRKNAKPEVRAKYDARWQYLAQREKHEWVYPHFRELTQGKCRGLGEIRLKALNKQHRPLGFWGPGEHEFTHVMFAIEKGSEFIPKDACKTGNERATEIRNDGSRADVPEFDRKSSK